MAKVSGKGKSLRSSGTGQFLTEGFAAKHPSTTVSETRGSGGTHRSAASGKFVSDTYAAKRPATTVKGSNLEQIEKSIAALPDQELKELAAWFDELRWERWDRQFEDDVRAGRLDKLVSDAKAEIAAGKTRPL